MKQEVYYNIRKWTPVPGAKLNNVPIKRKATGNSYHHASMWQQENGTKFI